MRPLLQEAEHSLTIREVVLAPESMIDDKIQGTKVEFVDRRHFQQWHQKLKKHPSPLKREQIKVASLLLKQCNTKARLRKHSSEQELGK